VKQNMNIHVAISWNK